MRAVVFFAQGDPKGQPRARACIRGERAGVYDPGTANTWKHAVADAWREVCRAESVRPWTSAVSLSLTFHFRRPAAHLRKDGSLRPTAPRHHASKPDADNLAKAVMDELTRLGAWADDKLVCRLLVERKWAALMPGCSIAIREAGE